MRNRMGAAALLLVFALALEVQATPSRVVDSARLRVGDVVNHIPAAAAAVDLGPAPPAGGTRLVSRAEVLEALKKAGHPGNKYRIPLTVRVTGASRVLEPEQVASTARAVVERALPPGVKLVKVDASSRVVLSPRAVPRATRLAGWPRQKGNARTSALIEWVCDERVVATSNLSLLVDVSEEAAAPDIRRGAALTLVVDKQRVQVSTTGTALADGMIGEVVRVTVKSTGRVVNARVASQDRAVVVDRQ